jgi:membrane protein YdbS with pleckstrin-like domain
MYIMETMWTLLRITASCVPCNGVGFAFWSVYDLDPGTVSGTSQANFISAVVVQLVIIAAYKYHNLWFHCHHISLYLQPT